MIVQRLTMLAGTCARSRLMPRLGRPKTVNGMHAAEMPGGRTRSGHITSDMTLEDNDSEFNSFELWLGELQGEADARSPNVLWATYLEAVDLVLQMHDEPILNHKAKR
jgi:hypothetical protein